MANKYRGSKGFVALGGVLTGSPLVQGAVAQAATSATFDGASLTGVLLEGDEFTVAGDAQVYTLTADALPVANAVAVEFTPAVVPGAGWADNAAVTFVANSIANVTSWEANPTRPVLDATVMGDTAKKTMLDIPHIDGRITCLVDLGDLPQAEMVDEVIADGDIGRIGLVLATAAGKHIYAHVAGTGAQLGAQKGALQEVSFNFEGDGAATLDW